MASQTSIADFRSLEDFGSLLEVYSCSRPLHRGKQALSRGSAVAVSVGERSDFRSLEDFGSLSVHPVQRVRQALAAAGLDPDLVRELPTDTGTAEAAARAVDAPAGSIVKSLVFLADDNPLLVLVAGDRRADVKRMRAELGLSKKRLRIAQPAEVFELTGFEVGGVPPLGHCRPLRTLVDRSLGRFEIVWAAAGSAHAVFPVRYAQLVDITQGEILDLAE